MTSRVLRAAFMLVVLALACGRATLDRARWQRMSKGDKTLYVRSLLGHERAKESKGGSQPSHAKPPEEYVRAIDAAYALGDERSVDTVFDTLKP